ncbi:MAG: molybdopterin-guanine dinucleotide biosynthesis protein B [Dehalococcoidia bacterium]|nr:molybdopterin-guanine dinucleotide biosynthesis protein B [Dehalococcoidia bacterium]
MPPVVSIVGKSRSGKTIVVERLIRELRSRAYRVATIKHAPRGASFDEPGKDSWRHIEAGSETVVVSSPNNIVLVKPVSEDASVEELVRLLGEDYDIILAEGFKQGSAPKIEVHRKEVGVPLRDIKKLIAIVTDEPLETKVRQFSFEDSKGLADLLERGFIKPQKERISLYVNNTPVPLTTFPKQIIKNVLVAMVSCLKGVKEVTSLQIFLREEDARK